MELSSFILSPSSENDPPELQNSDPEAVTIGTLSPRNNRSGRKKSACSACRTAKTRCSRGQPSCVRCLDEKLHCDYTIGHRSYTGVSARTAIDSGRGVGHMSLWASFAYCEQITISFLLRRRMYSGIHRCVTTLVYG
jgi:hypothetical protein